MRKSERIEKFLGSLDAGDDGGFSPYYLGYFRCFNAGDYYEAHDVLEHLWLGCDDGDRDFYKGLIQIAGAFVHLKKQYTRPDHPKDARRLRPATRLFAMGVAHIGRFAPAHLGLDVAGLCDLCRGLVREIDESAYAKNPWSPERMPVLHPGRGRV